MSIKMDCGDSLCIFAEDKSGVRTNGGCRCIPPGNAKLSIKCQQMVQEIAALKAEVEALRSMITLYNMGGCTDIERAGKDIATYKARAESAEAEVERLKKQLRYHSVSQNPAILHEEVLPVVVDD